MSETAPILDAVAAWAAAWESCRASQILALWDSTDKQAFYLPADAVAPHAGSAIVGVLQRRCIGLRAATYKPRQIQARRLSDDIGSAFFVLDWTRTGDDQITMGGMVRVTVVMRKRADGWRIFHYAEAPLAPLLELQAFYEGVAAEGLDAIPQRGPSS